MTPPDDLERYNPNMTSPNKMSLSFTPSKTPARKVLSDVEATGLEVTDFSTMDSDLEDIFIRLTHDDDALDTDTARS